MSVPVVLRPNNGSDPPTYTLIGECYLHTMMDGRATEVQAQRQNDLKENIMTHQAEIAKLEYKVARPDASPQERLRLRNHRQLLEDDQMELDLLTTQKFELR